MYRQRKISVLLIVLLIIFLLTAASIPVMKAGLKLSPAGTDSQDAVVIFLPGTVEAEGYEEHHGVLAELCDEGGYDIGWINRNDWMSYPVNVSQTGNYKVEFRVSGWGEGSFLLKSGENVLVTTGVPDTGGYQNWTSVYTNVYLIEGRQTLTIAATAEDWNINWIKFTYDGSSSTAVKIPGIIEAEEYDDMSGVEVQSCTEGGANVGWIDKGDWMSYKVNVARAGSYRAEYRVSGWNGGGAFQLKSGDNVLAVQTVPVTGDFQNWTIIVDNLSLSAGDQWLTIAATEPNWNLNWVKFTYQSNRGRGKKLPGTIQAEDYTDMRGIMIESCSEGGLCTGWVEEGSWLEYKVNLSSGGNYTVDYRAASHKKGAVIQLMVDGEVLSSAGLGKTGPGRSWKDITSSVNLKAGEHTIRLYSAGTPWSLDWFRISAGNTSPGESFVKKYRQLQVIGTQLCDQDGNAIQLKGMSSFWMNWGGSFVNAGVINTLAREWGASLYRVAMGVNEESGYAHNPDGMTNLIEEAVEASVKEGIYIIIDWHAHENLQDKEMEIAFFEDIARKYGHLPNVIYEIWNEPTTESWDDEIKPFSEAVIDAIRAIDPDNIIIVGSSTWSQDVDKAADNPIEGTNIMYALHFYAGTHGKDLRDKAEYALNKGLPIFASEWGGSAAGGGSLDRTFYKESSREWLGWMSRKKISWANWSLFDKDEVSAALRPGASRNGGWSESALTESGNFIKFYIK